MSKHTWNLNWASANQLKKNNRPDASKLGIYNFWNVSPKLSKNRHHYPASIGEWNGMNCIYHFGVHWTLGHSVFLCVGIESVIIIVIVLSVVMFLFPFRKTHRIYFNNIESPRNAQQQMWPLSNAMRSAFNVVYIPSNLLLYIHFCHSSI